MIWSSSRIYRPAALGHCARTVSLQPVGHFSNSTLVASRMFMSSVRSAMEKAVIFGKSSLIFASIKVTLLSQISILQKATRGTTLQASRTSRIGTGVNFSNGYRPVLGLPRDEATKAFRLTSMSVTALRRNPLAAATSDVPSSIKLPVALRGLQV